MSFATALATIDADAPTITQILTGAKSFDWAGLLTMWSSAPIQTRLQNGEDAVEIILEIAGLFFPPAAVAANDLQLADAVINFFAPIVAAIFIGQNLVPDGAGGYVSQAWAADPREQLNPDGTFKTP
ncbi:MAG: hypothetical protein ACLQIQ_08490 [Beijerinckiaceae bacterium]